MGEATGTEKAENGDNLTNQQLGIPAQYVQYDTKDLQRPPIGVLLDMSKSYSRRLFCVYQEYEIVFYPGRSTHNE